MAFPTASLNIALDAITSDITHAAAFDGDPQGGGSQVGDRVAVAFGDASGGEASITGDIPAVAVPAGATVDHWGFFTAATGGTLRASKDVPSETWNEEGEGGIARLTQGTLKLENKAD